MDDDKKELRRKKREAIVESGKLMLKHCDSCTKNPQNKESKDYNRWCNKNCEIGKRLRELGKILDAKENKVVEKSGPKTRKTYKKINWEAEMPKILILREEGMTLKQIAEKYNSTIKTVYLHLRKEKEKTNH